MFLPVRTPALRQAILSNFIVYHFFTFSLPPPTGFTFSLPFLYRESSVMSRA